MKTSRGARGVAGRLLGGEIHDRGCNGFGYRGYQRGLIFPFHILFTVGGEGRWGACDRWQALGLRRQDCSRAAFLGESMVVIATIGVSRGEVG